MPACQKCAQSKEPCMHSQGPLPVLLCPWSHVFTDFITGLAESYVNSVILVCVDCFSKGFKFVLLDKLPSAKETHVLSLQHVVRILAIQKIWCLTGLEGLLPLFDVTASLSLGFHPESNDQNKRAKSGPGTFPSISGRNQPYLLGTALHM